jgi:hypothetical protein
VGKTLIKSTASDGFLLRPERHSPNGRDEFRCGVIGERQTRNAR